MLAEELDTVFVAADRVGQKDIDVEDMTDLFVILCAIAFPCGIDALLGEEIVHGLGAGAEEILTGGGNISRWIVPGDGFQYPEPGVVIGELFAQIIQLQALPAI